MEAVFAFPESEPAARRLAAQLDLPCHVVGVRRFPDGESLVRIEPRVRRAFLFRSLDHPNDKLIELVLAAAALRDGGCRRITLVAPYMAYMRQDRAFHPGEAVSQRVIGRLIADAVERVLTVNPHLHRTSTIDEVFPGIEAVAVDAAPAFAEMLRADGIAPGMLVLGPDAESRPWAEALAGCLGVEARTAHKRRDGDRSIAVELRDAAPLTGRTVFLLDDIVSTGTTLVECAQAARAAGAARVEALVVHALHDEDMARRLAAAGIERLRSSDSVPHPSNAVTLAPLLAGALRTFAETME